MNVTSTFSVAGRCSSTGSLGAIVTSSSPAVGARCLSVKGKSGVILSQNVTDPRLASVGYSALEQGYDAKGAIRSMTNATPFPEYRQLAVVDGKGKSDVFTGEQALGVHGEYCSDNVVSIGNLLSDATIPEAMGEHFIDNGNLSLPERLISAIEVGFMMGGELDQEHSIGLIVYTYDNFPYVDLRIDYSDDPLRDLKQLWEIYGPQAEDYRVRALEPERAPSYNVKGDE
ncbi:putative Ntn-hydrolase superfamily protein [Scopulibacillus darangshiensis]|uniref:Putative Ntn-hydrolase superfamily protein n=1 Tax=Scopulibacillus darangshiensis TaxID=442528 RepID=A0A4R2P3Z9_9BACL|nr:DUF1028 domain-containing protein [Scopulibacillus darangshiensis]TCP29443.1 putative Ntn-hydrolase superfamily protein [Scopulibacillus darangshiensis]